MTQPQKSFKSMYLRTIIIVLPLQPIFRYVYLAASVVALLFAAYCLSKLFSAVREDVLSLAAEYSFCEFLPYLYSCPFICAQVMKEDASRCEWEYLSNACATASIPAMIDRCRAWKLCLEQNVNLAIGLKLFAEVMADWCNIFVEKITWKTTVSSTHQRPIFLGIFTGPNRHFCSSSFQPPLS